MIAEATRAEVARIARAEPRIAELMVWFGRQCLPVRRRSMREFAEAEIVLDSGPVRGRFRIHTQPFMGPWFDAVDSGRWITHVATGPTQSGKTLCALIAPTLYHLFEHGENVVLAAPVIDIAQEKYRDILLPAIERTRYRELLPRVGEGARGGEIKSSVRFRNGAVLKLMSGGGGDKSRASFTSRVLIVTEVDGMDKPASTSRESDPISQMIERTGAFGSRKRIFLECTVSTEDGRIWREYQGGTESRLILPCPHCATWVTPEREHLVGWRDAESEVDALDGARLACPACAAEWTEAERREANQSCRLLHHGQEIDGDGEVTGAPRRTRTFSMRWTAANNLLVPIAEVAVDEWKGARSDDQDNAEKQLRQFRWALPYLPRKLDESRIAVGQIMRRTTPLTRGTVPTDVRCISVGADCGKRLVHWVAIAWQSDASGHIYDYGRQEVPADAMPEDEALLLGLRELRDRLEAGWPAGDGERPHLPDLTLIDSGWLPGIVYRLCADDPERYIPTKGLGTGIFSTRKYREPRKTGSIVSYVGDRYHAVDLAGDAGQLLEFDADHWKSRVHERLRIPLTLPGALTLFDGASPNEHRSFANHLCAERRVQVYDAKLGDMFRWEAIKPSNHWLDATVLAMVAAHALGVRFVATGDVDPEASESPRPDRPSSGIRTPDGREYLISHRDPDA